MAIINDGVTIDKGLEASVMRRKMESKDTLATRGALYVGTGIPDDDSFTVTKSIAPSGADDDNQVLVADSKSPVGWSIKECPMATTVSTNIGKAKITDIFEDDGTTVKTAKMAKGLQSNTAQTTNGTNWYEFNGTNEYFGSTSSPTIIKTSEPRPKAEVKNGETTVMKEVALVEDIPRVGEWITVPGQTATLTEAGTYQVVLYGSDRNVQSIIYWDGSTAAQGTYSTVVDLLAGVYPAIASRFPQVTAEGILSFGWVVITQSDHGWTESNTTASGFKYSKIH